MTDDPGFSVEVEIQDLQEAISIDHQQVEDLVRFVLRRENHGGRVGICFVDDERIAQLHGEFMDDPTATDVITFPLEETIAELVDGEIVISTDTALKQASEHNFGPLREVHLYVVHGLLHLLGHDDLDPQEAEQMRRLQEAHLGSWNRFRGVTDD
ncbi:MAG: rRNA maturation RNase YbeY [Planctomycetota bacterium]|nr:rRNA maturation RNase YbeY [Planctomycetota bacterium]